MLHDTAPPNEVFCLTTTLATIAPTGTEFSIAGRQGPDFHYTNCNIPEFPKRIPRQCGKTIVS